MTVNSSSPYPQVDLSTAESLFKRKPVIVFYRSHIVNK